MGISVATGHECWLQPVSDEEGLETARGGRVNNTSAPLPCTPHTCLVTLKLGSAREKEQGGRGWRSKGQLCPVVPAVVRCVRRGGDCLTVHIAEVTRSQVGLLRLIVVTKQAPCKRGALPLHLAWPWCAPAAGCAACRRRCAACRFHSWLCGRM